MMRKPNHVPKIYNPVIYIKVSFHNFKQHKTLDTRRKQAIM